MTSDDILFREVQRFRQPVLVAIIIATTLVPMILLGYGMVSQLVFGKPFGDEPMSDMALLMVGLICILPLPVVAWLFLASKLETTVSSNGLYVRFYPFHLRERKIELEKVVSFRALTYRPIWDYGGWGLRFGKGGRAYNVSGRSGVRLEFDNGKHLLIGSQRSEELAAAIETFLKESA